MSKRGKVSLVQLHGVLAKAVEVLKRKPDRRAL